jgi:hypothetical protein
VKFLINSLKSIIHRRAAVQWVQARLQQEKLWSAHSGPRRGAGQARGELLPIFILSSSFHQQEKIMFF